MDTTVNMSAGGVDALIAAQCKPAQPSDVECTLCDDGDILRRIAELVELQERICETVDIPRTVRIDDLLDIIKP